MVEIETERLLMRGWRDGDLEPYARMCADPEVMRFIGNGSTLTREGSREQISRFLRHWEERGFGLWALEEKTGGTFVGFAGLAHQEDWAEGGHKTEGGWRLARGVRGRGAAGGAAEGGGDAGVGWGLARACGGRGLATEAAKASVAYGLEKVGLKRIISIIQ